jgi:hypothetical protein
MRNIYVLTVTQAPIFTTEQPTTPISSTPTPPITSTIPSTSKKHSTVQITTPQIPSTTKPPLVPGTLPPAG